MIKCPTSPNTSHPSPSKEGLAKGAQPVDMPHIIDDPADDDTFGFGYNAFIKGSPDVQAMTEACASGDLIAAQSVFEIRWLDQAADQRGRQDVFGAGAFCEVIRHDNANVTQFLLFNLLSTHD